MLKLLRSESRRNSFSEKLNELNANKEEAHFNAMLEESTSKRDKAMAKVQKLESENKELIEAFQMFSAETNEQSVDKLVLNFVSRDANQQKLQRTRDAAGIRLQEAKKKHEKLQNDLKMAKVALRTAEQNSSTSTKSRKRRDELYRVLKPKSKSRDRQKKEFEKRLSQLKSIQRVLLHINSLGDSASGKVSRGPYQEQRVVRANNFQFPKSPTTKKSTQRKRSSKQRKNSKGSNGYGKGNRKTLILILMINTELNKI